MLLAAALALVAAWPLALAGWLIGRLTERATRAAGLREAVWGFALALPVIVLVEAVAWPVLRTGAYTSTLSAVAAMSVLSVVSLVFVVFFVVLVVLFVF